MNRHDQSARAAGPEERSPERTATESERPGGITCSEAAERLYEYLDAELGPEGAQAVREHLRVCEACYPRLTFEESFRTLVRRVEEGQAASKNLKSRVLELLREEGLAEPD